MPDTGLKLIAAADKRRRGSHKNPDIARFQLAQLRRLLRHRNQIPLPDDRRSRRYLQAMLDLGLTGPVAQRVAPWLSGDELDQMIGACAVSPGWNARTLGEHFGVTMKEKFDLDLRNLDAFDADRWQYLRALAERQRLKDAERGRHRRARAKQEKQMTTAADNIIMRPAPPGTPWNMIDMIEASHARQRALYNWATGKDWLAIYDMARDSLRRDVPAYDRPDVHTIERMLRRDIDELIRLGLFDQRKVAKPANGGPPRRVFRQAIRDPGAGHDD
jgi:hypothetical protein